MRCVAGVLSVLFRRGVLWADKRRLVLNLGLAKAG